MTRVWGVLMFAAFGLCACDNTTVAVCVGDVEFCNTRAQPVAAAGPDQNALAGAPVKLDGSDSRGGFRSIHSYSWAQTGGPTVALVDANKAKASFVAPDVAADAVLTFRLTVVDSTNVADSNSTNVMVEPVTATAIALQLLDGPLRPSAAWAQDVDGCPSATDPLTADAAAAQLGLWLAGRTLAIVKGLDARDPSQWLDLVRVLVAERQAPSSHAAGRLESFGFVLFASALRERDPALQQAIATHLARAPMLDDPAGLLAGQYHVWDADTVRVEPTADRDAAIRAARARVLAARSSCVSPAAAVERTADSLVVIAGVEAD